MLLEEFGNVIARGGAGIVIASQSGHRLGALSTEQNAALARAVIGGLMAATIATLPVVLAGWIAQRQLVRGLSFGAIK